MTLRPAAVALALVLVSLNSSAAANNSGGASGEGPAAGAPPSIQDPGTRKLSRSERKERIRNLAEKYRQFLRDVEPIMLAEELSTFLILESDAQRDLYIEEFWRRRDNDPVTPHNEYRDQYYLRMEEAKAEFRHLISDRARIYLVRGRPAARYKIDCERYLQPLEVWRYAGERQWSGDYWVLFYQPRVGAADYRIWQPMGGQFEALGELLSRDGERRGAAEVFYAPRGGGGDLWLNCKDGDQVQAAVNWILNNRLEVAKMFEPPAIDTEDVNKILRSVVLANPDAPKIDASMEARYPGKRGARTSVEMTLSVAKADLRVNDLEGARFYNLDVNGEVLKDGKLFENFRYRYDFPADTPGDRLSVVIERFLRPADYQARIKVADANSGAEAVLENPLDVPYVKETVEHRRRELEGSMAVSRLYEDYRSGESRIRLIPLEGDILTGLQRIETIVTGEAIRAVEFYLDNSKIMTKRQPPYSLDLDFGEVPRLRRVKAIGLDEKGTFIAGDELVVNIGSDPFRVWIEEPRITKNVSGRVRVAIAANAPEGSSIRKVELWLNEARVATLYEKPYVQTIHLPASMGVGYLRAVAWLDDEKAQPTEDVVFLNSPEFLQEIDVHLVELPITVIRDGRPLLDLPQSAFQVTDEGEPVQISKFEYVKDLPLSLGLAMDTSGSMQPRIEEARKAGAQFFKNVLRAGDKAFVIGFDSEAYVVQKWSRNLSDLHAGLASLRAEEATALYDALVYALYNFQGVKGQKALVVLSDGKDTASKFSFDQALEYARRAAVPIYAVGIGIRATEVEVKHKLNQLATQTGGNTYYIETAAGLGPIYSDIENELRSQYVIGFYPPSEVKPGGDWRTVNVKVEGAAAKTIQGYYP